MADLSLLIASSLMGIFVGLVLFSMVDKFSWTRSKKQIALEVTALASLLLREKKELRLLDQHKIALLTSDDVQAVINVLSVASGLTHRDRESTAVNAWIAQLQLWKKDHF